MIGPVKRWRNRKAAASIVNDPEFQAMIDEADQACADDLAALEAAGADESFADLLMAVEPPPDPATDGVEHD